MTPQEFIDAAMFALDNTDAIDLDVAFSSDDEFLAAVEKLILLVLPEKGNA